MCSRKEEQLFILFFSFRCCILVNQIEQVSLYLLKCFSYFREKQQRYRLLFVCLSVCPSCSAFHLFYYLKRFIQKEREHKQKSNNNEVAFFFSLSQSVFVLLLLFAFFFGKDHRSSSFLRESVCVFSLFYFPKKRKAKTEQPLGALLRLSQLVSHLKMRLEKFTYDDDDDDNDRLCTKTLRLQFGEPKRKVAPPQETHAFFALTITMVFVLPFSLSFQ